MSEPIQSRYSFAEGGLRISHELTGVLDCFSQNVLCGRLYRHIRLLWILRVCKMPGHLRLRPKFECVSLNLQQGLRCKGCGICGNSECGEVYMY